MEKERKGGEAIAATAWSHRRHRPPPFLQPDLGGERGVVAATALPPAPTTVAGERRKERWEERGGEGRGARMGGMQGGVKGEGLR